MVIITTGYSYTERQLDMLKHSTSKCTCMLKMHCSSQQVVVFHAEVGMLQGLTEEGMHSETRKKLTNLETN